MLYQDTKPGQIKQDRQRGPAVENRGKTYKTVVTFPFTNPNGDLIQGQQTGIFDDNSLIINKLESLMIIR